MRRGLARGKTTASTGPATRKMIPAARSAPLLGASGAGRYRRGPNEAERDQRVAHAPRVPGEHREREVELFARELPAANEVLAQQLVRIARGHVVQPPVDEVELRYGSPSAAPLSAVRSAKLHPRSRARRGREGARSASAPSGEVVEEVGLAGAGELVRRRGPHREVARELLDLLDGGVASPHVEGSFLVPSPAICPVAHASIRRANVHGPCFVLSAAEHVRRELTVLAGGALERPASRAALATGPPRRRASSARCRARRSSRPSRGRPGRTSPARRAPSPPRASPARTASAPGRTGRPSWNRFDSGRASARWSTS